MTITRASTTYLITPIGDQLLFTPTDKTKVTFKKSRIKYEQQMKHLK